MKRTWFFSIFFAFAIYVFYRDIIYLFNSIPDDNHHPSEMKKIVGRLIGFDGDVPEKLRIKFTYATTSKLCENVINWPFVVTSPRFFIQKKHIEIDVDRRFLFEFSDSPARRGLCGWRLYRIDYDVNLHRNTLCSGTVAGLNGYNSHDIGREQFNFNGTTDVCKPLGKPGLFSDKVIIFEPGENLLHKSARRLG
ncbi:hypothetical protein [Vogesella sp. EB]|uniref:hypothetical protein n=1 Tax=Vogesella sp. EB TaxID=1526735 RepID=UPI0012E03763|nr:hypothetical protein [Vogesella sp. EB]